MQTRFKSLLLPETSLSVKVIFDNVRNYAICAGFLALTVWLDAGAAGVPAHAVGPKFPVVAPYIAYVAAFMGGLFFLLNVGQSFEIAALALKTLEQPLDRFVDRAAERAGPVAARLLFVALMLGLLLFFVAILLLAALVALVICLMIVYTATGIRAA